MNCFSVGEYIVGRYLVKQVNKGGMFVVYFCHDELFDRPIAIKTFKFKSPQQIEILTEGFVQGAKKWILIGDERNVVRAYDVFTTPINDDLRLPYLAIELVEGNPIYGNSLRGWIHKSGLDLKLVLYFAQTICSGMVRIQKKLGGKKSNFVHFNLKPQNILISREGSVKITDIGLCEGLQKSALKIEPFPTSLMDHNSNYYSRVINVIFGSPPYMSPEQCMGLQSYDQRSDIYSLGCILYEMCTKRFIFNAKSVSEFIAKHIYDNPIPLKQWNSHIPDSLQKIIESCLSKNPEERPSNFEEVRDSIGDILKIERLHSGVRFWLFGFSAFTENPRVKSDWEMKKDEEAFILGKTFGVEYIIRQGLVKDRAEFEELVVERELSSQERQKEYEKNKRWNEASALVQMGDSLFKLAEVSKNVTEEEKIIRSSLSKYHSADKILPSDPKISFRLGMTYLCLADLVRAKNETLSDELIRLSIKCHTLILEKKMNPTFDIIGDMHYLLPFHALWHRAAAYTLKADFDMAIEDLELLLSLLETKDLSNFPKFSDKLKQTTGEFMEFIINKKKDAYQNPYKRQ